MGGHETGGGKVGEGAGAKLGKPVPPGLKPLILN